jgi:phosphoglucosamine mutase
MITAIKVLTVMREENKSLRQLVAGFSRYPQVLLNVRVREKRPFEDIAAVQVKVREIDDALGDRGRLLLRYSGTESLARVMIEGKDEPQVKSLADELATIIQQEIGEEKPGS